MNNNHKVLRIIRLEERKTQTKGLSRNFVSLFVKLFLSFLAAVMVSFLFVGFTFYIIAKEVIFKESHLGFGSFIGLEVIPVSLLLALAFTLTLTLTILLFAFYKMDGIHEGWTLDRATRAEKSIIWFWIFLVVLALCLTLVPIIYLVESTHYDYFAYFMPLYPPLVLPVLVLLLVFFAFTANVGKAYRSRVEEFILKENKDESTEKNTKRIKIIRLKRRETQKEGLSPSFISFFVKILFFLLVVAMLSFFFFGFLFGFDHFEPLGWPVVFFQASVFTLILTLIMLSIAFYKVNGVDEGWTVDRATGMEKVVIALWILSLGVGIFISVPMVTKFDNYIEILACTYTSSSIPSILALFIVLFASIIKTAKAYRSRIEELIIPEDKNE